MDFIEATKTIKELCPWCRLSGVSNLSFGFAG